MCITAIEGAHQKPTRWHLLSALFSLICLECGHQYANTPCLLRFDLLVVYLQKYQHILFGLVVLPCVFGEGARLLLAVNAGSERRRGDYIVVYSIYTPCCLHQQMVVLPACTVRTVYWCKRGCVLAETITQCCICQFRARS